MSNLYEEQGGPGFIPPAPDGDRAAQIEAHTAAARAEKKALKEAVVSRLVAELGQLQPGQSFSKARLNQITEGMKYPTNVIAEAREILHKKKGMLFKALRGEGRAGLMCLGVNGKIEVAYGHSQTSYRASERALAALETLQGCDLNAEQRATADAIRVATTNSQKLVDRQTIEKLKDTAGDERASQDRMLHELFGFAFVRAQRAN